MLLSRLVAYSFVLPYIFPVSSSHRFNNVRFLLCKCPEFLTIHSANIFLTYILLFWFILKISYLKLRLCQSLFLLEIFNCSQVDENIFIHYFILPFFYILYYITEYFDVFRLMTSTWDRKKIFYNVFLLSVSITILLLDRRNNFRFIPNR